MTYLGTRPPTVDEWDKYELHKNSIVGKMDDDLLEEMTHKLGENIESFLEIPEENIILEVVSEYFSKVFSSQTNSLLDKEKYNTELQVIEVQMGKDISVHDKEKFELAL